ncbi:MAG: DUF732 domain-containing protein [Mycobacterium sp.]
MRRSILLAPLVALMTAAPAHADTDQDTKFLGAIDKLGVPYTNSQDMIVGAHAVCLYLGPTNGGDYVGAVTGLKDRHPEWTSQQRGAFIGASVGVYCRDEASALPI